MSVQLHPDPAPAPHPGRNQVPHSHQPFEVLDLCHQQTVRALRQLGELLTHVQANGVDSRAQGTAQAVFEFFSRAAREHHLDEEKHIFPALLESGDEYLVQQVLRLLQDHGWIEEDWLELAPHIEAIGAGYNWYNIDIMAHAIPVFQALYLDHIALEESLIYPHAKARMAARVMLDMGREMASRRRAARAPAPEPD